MDGCMYVTTLGGREEAYTCCRDEAVMRGGVQQ